MSPGGSPGPRYPGEKPCNQQQQKLASMVMDGVTCPPSVCALSAVHTEVMARLILDCDRL